MNTSVIERCATRVPRYTSYPTAPHFHRGIGASEYERWLAALQPHEELSLYVHVPFCRSLCWFCACHTRAVQRNAPIERYTELVHREIDLVADRIGHRANVRHVHWGGGTPTILSPKAMSDLAARIRKRFALTADAEFAVEVDPRTLTREVAVAMRTVGVNRASLGVQDLNPAVQRAIHRWQPLRQVRQAVAWLRGVGVRSLSVDLMYGLPHQSASSLMETAGAVADLNPERIALFGYAHVPWFKRNQRAMDTDLLPGPQERLRQYRAASQTLTEHGYTAIGLDHFARPGDSLARAQRAGRLHRNFQGYTTDYGTPLLGFGLSAIGSLAQGFVQNTVDEASYCEAIESDSLPIVRGIATSAQDRLRWAIVERLMCDLRVDIAHVCAEHETDPESLARELAALEPLVSEGLVQRNGLVLEVPAEARALLRNVCAIFDQYLEPGTTTHAMAV